MEITRLKTNKFKTNLCALFLTVPSSKETVSKNALLVSVLRRGTKKLQSQEQISKKLEEMYGAGFNCGVDKIGNYHVLKFYLETIDNAYTFNNENLLQENINLLLEIAFNPLMENGVFKQELVDIEKENLIKILSARQDNKIMYSIDRCIEEMFENEPYGLYKYGDINEIEKITAKDLYEYYQKLLKKCRMDLFVLGENIENVTIPKIESSNLQQINVTHMPREKTKVVKEKLDVAQGKLIIGLNMPKENKSAVAMFNMILGGGANSILFQNVREKASLAYSASSSYIKRQNLIIIKTGIEIENYEKTKEIIKQQLQEIKNGNVTDEEFEAAKKLITASIKEIPESAENMITYYFDQRLFNENISTQEYYNNLKNVTKQEVIDVAQDVKIDTIYFLKRED